MNLNWSSIFVLCIQSCCPWIWTLKFELYCYVRGLHLITISSSYYYYCCYYYESRHLSSQTAKRLQYDTGEPYLFLLMCLSSAASTNCRSQNSVWKLNTEHFQTKFWIIYIFSLIFSACWTKCVFNRLVPLKSEMACDMEVNWHPHSTMLREWWFTRLYCSEHDTSCQLEKPKSIMSLSQYE